MHLELLGFLGYVAASFAYFIFILLLLAARNKTLAGRLVLLASLCTLLSFAGGSLQFKYHFSLQVIFGFETLKLALWSLLILSTKEKVFSLSQAIKQPAIQQYLLVWGALSLLVWLVVLTGFAETKYLFILFLVLNLWALVQLEQLYRNAGAGSKWALWPLVIALGAIFVFDFVLFAQASMLNQLNFDLWYVRSIIAVISVPLLLVSTRRMKNWSVNVFISREVVFYSSMLMISGLYLLVMAFAGYIINYIGGAWGSNLSIIFIVLGSIVLAALLMTEKLRREVKVFITKHFFANKYEYRVEWLKLIKQLEISQSGNYYQTALHCICSALQIPHGVLIKKQSQGHYNILYSEGIDVSEDLCEQLENIDKFCQKKAWIIDIREYDKLVNSYPELFIDSDVFIQKHIAIVVPIVVGDDLYGFFLLASPPETKNLLNWEDRDLLAAIAKQLGHYLSLNEANEKLSQAKQFDAFNRMSAFLIHDLKNIQAQLALISSNAKKHRHNPEFIADAFETVESATARLEKVLTQLRNKNVIETHSKKVKLKTLLQAVIEQRNQDLPQVTLTDFADIEICIDAETFSSVINHLVQNAQEATSADGWVNIKVIDKQDQFEIIISDNGCGMSAEFIKSRLFKPFDTTKGNAGMGIGVFEAKQFVEQLGGNIYVESIESEGTKFHLIIPKKQQ